MAKPKSKRRRGGKTPAEQAPLNVPEFLEKTHGPDWIMDSMPPEFRATLSAFAAPGAPADGLTLAAGKTFSERLRHRSDFAKYAEAEYPNLHETEANAPTLWAQHRENSAKWFGELEVGIAACRKAFEDGNLGALMDVLVHCTHRDGCLFGFLGDHPDHWVGLPRWAVDALTILAGETIPAIRAQKRGKHAKWHASWKQDQIDFRRWETVKMLREHGVRFTDGAVYQKAAGMLDFEIPGGADAVRLSYLRVQQRMKTQPSRYFPLEYGRSMNPGD